MRFDMDNLNPPTRFYFDDTKQDEGWVDLRVVTAGGVSDVVDQTTKKRVEYKLNTATKKMERIEFTETDDNALVEELWDKGIVDWLLLSTAGNPIPCTKENKIKLMSENPQFNSFVNKGLASLSNYEDVEVEEAEKNS